MGLIPGQGAKLPYAAKPNLKKKKRFYFMNQISFFSLDIWLGDGEVKDSFLKQNPGPVWVKDI